MQGCPLLRGVMTVGLWVAQRRCEDLQPHTNNSSYQWYTLEVALEKNHWNPLATQPQVISSKTQELEAIALRFAVRVFSVVLGGRD